MTPDDIRKLLASAWDDSADTFEVGDLVHVTSEFTKFGGAKFGGAIGTIAPTSEGSARLGGVTVIVFFPLAGAITPIPMTFMPDELELIASGGAS